MADQQKQARTDGEPSSDLVLEITRRFRAPRETVFAAITQPEIFQKWWGPKGCQCRECELDLRVGGRWTTTLIGEKDCKNSVVGGVYKEITAPSRLVFTWRWLQSDGTPGHETVVTIDLHDEGDKTLMKFTQQIFDDPEQCHKHRDGWESSYDCLDRYLDEERKV